MTKVLVAAFVGVGILLIMLGLIVQRRALAQHGTEEGKRAVSLFQPRPSARVTRWFQNDAGLDAYLKGQSFVSIGLTLTIAGIAYGAGRGW